MASGNLGRGTPATLNLVQVIGPGPGPWVGVGVGLADLVADRVMTTGVANGAGSVRDRARRHLAASGSVRPQVKPRGLVWGCLWWCDVW